MAMAVKARSDALAAVHETAAGLHRAGLIAARPCASSMRYA
jgi:hypothetical protein